jgi:hypothetical protein
VQLHLLYGGGDNTPFIALRDPPFIWHMTSQDKSSKGIDEYRFHTYNQERLCEKCHSFNFYNKNFKENKMLNSTCQSCHKYLLQGTHVHNVIQQSADCLKCCQRQLHTTTDDNYILPSLDV